MIYDILLIYTISIGTEKNNTLEQISLQNKLESKEAKTYFSKDKNSISTRK